MPSLFKWPQDLSHRCAAEYLSEMENWKAENGPLSKDVIKQIQSQMWLRNTDIIDVITSCMQHFANWHLLARRFCGSRTDLSKSRSEFDRVFEGINNLRSRLGKFSFIDRGTINEKLHERRPGLQLSSLNVLSVDDMLETLAEAVSISKPVIKRGGRDDYVLNCTVIAMSHFLEALAHADMASATAAAQKNAVLNSLGLSEADLKGANDIQITDLGAGRISVKAKGAVRSAMWDRQVVAFRTTFPQSGGAVHCTAIAMSDR